MKCSVFSFSILKGLTVSGSYFNKCILGKYLVEYLNKLSSVPSVASTLIFSNVTSSTPNCFPLNGESG